MPGQGPPPGAGGQREPTLPEFDAFTRQTSWIEVFNRGATPLAFDVRRRRAVRAARRDARYAVGTEQRISVSIDWTAAPAGTHDGADHRLVARTGRSVVVRALVRNPASPRREAVQGFVGSNGYVSMEAEHYTRAVARGADPVDAHPGSRPDAVGHDRRAGDDGEPDAGRDGAAARVPHVPLRQRRGDRAGVSVADAQLLRRRARAALRGLDRRRAAADRERHGG